MLLISRVTLDMLSVQGNSELQWDQKYNKSFWRGRDSRRERLNLIDLAKKHPDLIDAKITNFFFFRDEMEEYGGSSSSISFFKFFQVSHLLKTVISVCDCTFLCIYACFCVYLCMHFLLYV